MTKEISHQYDEILHGSLPGLEVHVVYDCESQITYDDDGEESNILTAITATVNGAPADVKFPEAKHGQQVREFLARLRESARQALYAQELREQSAANAKFSIGEKVVYRVPGKPDRRGVTTSIPNRDNRVGVKFEDEDWAYCHTDFIFAHPFAFQTGEK